MYCSNCGKKLTEEAKFCPSCGTPVHKSEEIEVQEPAHSDARVTSRESSTITPQTNSAHQTATGTIYFVGGLSVILGLITLFTGSFFGIVFDAPYTLIGGIVFLILGYFVGKRSMLALLIAIIFYAYDTLMSLTNLIQGGLVVVIIMHVIFLISMLRGIGGIKALNQPNKNTPYNRLSRKNYIVASVVTGIFSLLFLGFGKYAESHGLIINNVFTFLNGLFVIVFFLTLFFTFSICKRRFHDLGQSGWRILLLLIPFVNIIFGLILLLKKGTDETNRYGSPPRDEINLKAIFRISKIQVVFMVFVVILVGAELNVIPSGIPNKIGEAINKIMPASSNSINMGYYNGRKYSNSSFGISFTIPDGMYIGSNESISSLFKTNSSYYDDQPSKELLQQLKNEKSIVFTFASIRRNGPSSNFSFGADKVSAQSIFKSKIPSSKDFMEAYKTQLTSTDPAFSFSNITSQIIGGVEFSSLHVKKPLSFDQDVYVTQRNGYYISFINSYNNNSDKSILDSIISSVQFDETPVDEGWMINNFQSNISIQKSGEIIITENIEVDFKDLQKHGISRDIPNVYRLAGKQIPSEVTVRQVKLNNVDVRYKILNSGKYFTIQIGDANKTISGINTYQIEYILNGGVLKQLSDNDEFYWNVTGNNWTVPIAKTEAEITLPIGEIIKVDCFDGLSGVSSTCSVAMTSSTLARFSMKENKSGGGMIVVVEYHKD